MTVPDNIQAILDEAVDAFEAKFTRIVHGNYAYAPTKEKYVEILSGQAADKSWFCYCLTPEYAIEMWKVQISDYASSRSGTLFWRVRPEIDHWDCALRGDALNSHPVEFLRVWKVYSRLLISDKPETVPAILPPRVGIQERGYAAIPAVES
jgi:hypothetical protein